MRRRLGRAWGDYWDLWAEVPWYGWPWLIMVTVIPIVPVILIVHQPEEEEP